MRLAVTVGVLLAAPLARAKPADDIAKLVDTQIKAWSKQSIDAPVDEDALYVAPGSFTITGDSAADDVANTTASRLSGNVVSGMYTIDHKVSDRAIGTSRDGKTAWISFGIWMKVDNSSDGEKMIFDRDFRVTEIAVATKDGWRLAGGTWSSAQPNDTVNKEARAGKRKLAELPKASESKPLLDAFTAMLTTAMPPTTKDMVVIGSAPGERTVGGAVFAKAWDAAWRGHVSVIGAPVVHVAPSNTTGWVIANIALAKKAGGTTYTVPFRVFCVFDQGDGGAWTLVHAHFAVAPR